MATAYAALTSVMKIIDQIQTHPRPPISLHQQQIQSLVETISFLQEFLEAGYTNQVSYDSEPHPLDMLIADAAHAAEDVIESHIMDNILADGEGVSAVDLYESLHKVIDDMEAVKKEAMAVKEKTKGHQHQIRGEDSSTFAASSSFAGPEQFNAMVGFDDILIQVLDTLTSDESRRQIISLTGMGGMGKTTLARNVYQHLVEHFDIRAWVTVSQQYKVRNIFLKLLEGSGENLSQVDEYELGTILHKTLVGRRYLIVLDDIWNIEIWDTLRLFLPDNNDRSRILITTRLSNLAREIDNSHNIEMPILDEDNAWELFCKHVFREEDCPYELEAIGKRIVEGCKGLPLSISVVGGLLGKSKWEKQYWEDIADNLNSTVNNEHCLQILYMSYYNLPVHLKPIFLFLGTVLDHEEFFPLYFFVQILVAEGLVKPVRGKSLEEVAVVCISELVERNLISIHKTDINTDYWMYKVCWIHDLLRDLCLRESQKQKFIYCVGEQIVDTIPQNINSIRRLCVAKNTSEAVVLPFLESASLLRSLWWIFSTFLSLPSIKSRLLRIVVADGMTDPDDTHKFNLRVILICDPNLLTSITLFRFWNVHMIWGIDMSSSDVIMAQYDIWNMSQLRSIMTIPLCLPDPPGREDCGIILENLHMMGKICNFKCSEEVVKRISHIKHLQLHFTHIVEESYCLHNLGRLQQLEFLGIEVDTQTHTIKNQNLNITFPRSLISLYLSGTRLHWDEVTANIGPLPHLQVLQLYGDSCIGAKWETIEGQFCHLELLRIVECCDLENWTTESTHFPRLETLILKDFDKLKEIPSSVGDIPTLELIKLKRCCDSANYSARSIKEEQEELGNEDLYVIIDGELV